MTPIEDRLLAIDLEEAEQDPLERRRWRQYACAALIGLTSRVAINLDRQEAAAAYADDMLKLERERFEKGAP